MSSRLSSRRGIRLVALASTLVLAILGPGAGSVAAYGHADQPLAQIEFSANCNNPDFPLCAPPPAGFGLGGIWLWIELDTGGAGDVAGAGCGHVRGVGGGAGSIRGDVQWFINHGEPIGIPLFYTDPNHDYYIVDLGGGEIFAFPVTVGHYSANPVPGVAIQLQVAP